MTVLGVVLVVLGAALVLLTVGGAAAGDDSGPPHFFCKIILRAGARCRRPPCRDRQGWCTDWLARSGWPKFAEGREKGGRREEGGGREAGTGKREGGGRREGRKRDFPVVLGVQGGSLGALERCLGGLGWSSGVPGVLLGYSRGLFGCSWALPRGSWDVFWGSVVPVEPKRTILRTSSWASWQAGLLLKGQRATKQEKVEHVCQETKTDDSGDLFLGLLASMFAVERATGDRADNSRTWLPGDRNGRFWGPPFRPPGNHVHCRKKERPRRTPARENTGPLG